MKKFLPKSLLADKDIPNGSLVYLGYDNTHYRKLLHSGQMFKNRIFGVVMSEGIQVGGEIQFSFNKLGVGNVIT